MTSRITTTLLAIVITMGGVFSFFISDAAAQMKGGAMMDNDDGLMRGMGPGGIAGNQSAMMQIMGAGENITGSINLHSVISNAIASQVNTSLGEAASIAEGAVGNNSHAVAAHIGDANGYLVYTVWVFGADMNINRVVVDPGDGQVLSNMPISMKQMMGMMGSGMGPGMMGMGMMGSGMGPGMMDDESMRGMGPGMMDDESMRGMGPGMMDDESMRGMGPGMMDDDDDEFMRGMMR
jgi:hypothetical protein